MGDAVNPPPATPVVCEGSYREMGAAQGAHLRAEILRAYDALREIEAFCLMRPWWMPFTWFRRLAGSRVSRTATPAVSRLCPSAYERTIGLAEGAGVRMESLWLLQAMEGVLGSVAGAVDLPPAGCSAVAVRGPAAESGRPMIAHNFDYLPAVRPFFTVRRSRPRGGLRSVEFTAAPRSGAINGVNEGGLAVTYNYAQTIDKGEPGPTISMRIAEVLSSVSRTADAVRTFVARERWGSGILMVADASGDIASVELSNTRAEVRQPSAGTDVLYHANKFVCGPTSGVEVPVAAVYNSRAPRPLRGQRVLDSSLRRMARFDGLLSESAGLGPDALARLMADHDGGPPSDSTICMHSDYWVTTACVQCLPADRVIRVSFGTACAAKYLNYSV